MNSASRSPFSAFPSPVPDYTATLDAPAPFFLVMGADGAGHRLGAISDEMETGVMRLVLNLPAPCLFSLKSRAIPISTALVSPPGRLAAVRR